MAVALVKKGDHINLAEKATLVGWTNHRVGAKFQRIQDVAFYDEFPHKRPRRCQSRPLGTNGKALNSRRVGFHNEKKKHTWKI